MTDDDWADVQEAVNTVVRRRALRVDGEKWKVYRAGAIIRIDISVEEFS